MKGKLVYWKSRSLWQDILKANYSKQTHLKVMHLTISDNISITCTTSSQFPNSCSSSYTLTSNSPNPSLPSREDGGYYYVYPLQCWGRDGSAVNTLRTGDADLRFYITTVQDGWRKSAFLKRACFPCTIHLIMQYIESVSEWSCWRMFIETWPHSELNFRHRASSI